VPILVFLGLSVLDLGPMYATDRQTDRQTDVRCVSSLNVSALWGRGIIIIKDPTTHRTHCYTTLSKVNVKKLATI